MKKIYVWLGGGMGNQMFQYACARAIEYNNKDVKPVYIYRNGPVKHAILGINHCNIEKIDVIERLPNIIQKYILMFIARRKNGSCEKLNAVVNRLGIFYCMDGYVRFDKVRRKNNILFGYFQSSKFFADIADDIKRELRITDRLNETAEGILKEIQGHNSVCIHVRRNDYVGGEFDVCNKNYFLKGIETIRGKVTDPHFYVFSDDIEWCKENLDLKCGEATFCSGENTQYEDLRLMYECKHFIISNSSFSWWAQFLSEEKNKVVVAPSMWKKDGTCKEIFDSSWIKVSV